MNLFKAFLFVQQFAQRLGPHNEKLVGILLPIALEVANGMIDDTVTIMGLRITAKSATDASPHRLSLSEIVQALEAYVIGHQATVSTGTTIITIELASQVPA